MIDYRLIHLIETVGCINENGERIYGTAALLRVLHRPIDSISNKHIEIGKSYVQKYLNA